MVIRQFSLRRARAFLRAATVYFFCYTCNAWKPEGHTCK